MKVKDLLTVLKSSIKLSVYDYDEKLVSGCYRLDNFNQEDMQKIALLKDEEIHQILGGNTQFMPSRADIEISISLMKTKAQLKREYEL